jgi:hypothetical protein
MILAEDLKWLTDWWISLVNEIVNALLPGYQFRSLPNKRICRSAERQFFGITLTRVASDGFAVPPQAAAWVAAESSS